MADSSLTAFANEADVVVVPDALVALGVRAQLTALLGVAARTETGGRAGGKGGDGGMRIRDEDGG